jgi:hypothetical protein
MTRYGRFGGMIIATTIMLASACALPQAMFLAPATLPPPTNPPEIISAPDLSTPTVEALGSTPTSSAMATLTPPPAVIMLATGNLNLRRGPGIAYDILGTLLRGEHGQATARNQTGDWVFICGLNDSCTPGWVSAQSPFVQLIGDAAGIGSLPVKAVDPAVPAYLRNCTFHPMKITPGDFILKEQFAAPANKKQVNPGVYAAYDQNQVGHPKVFSVQIKEGSSVDIVKDGLGNKYSCP